MNKWECEQHGCDIEAIGAGGAIGLRAIGWWFVPGQGLRCPAHRPDPVPCHQKYNEPYHGMTCVLCAADDEAKSLQNLIINELELQAVYGAL